MRVYRVCIFALSARRNPRMDLFTPYSKSTNGRMILVVGFIAMLFASWLMRDRVFQIVPGVMPQWAQGPLFIYKAAGQSPLRLPETRDIELIGCWPRIQGDPEMDTGPGDYIPVRCSSNIYIDGNKVMLKVFFRVEEDGGDHTIYSGARTVVLFVNDRPDFRISTVELRGPRLNNFILYSAGVSKDFRSMGPLDSYWETLEYRIDSPEDDQLHIGIRGRLSFSVVLEKANAIVDALSGRS